MLGDTCVNLFCLIQIQGGKAHAFFVLISAETTSSSIYIPPRFSAGTFLDKTTVQLCEWKDRENRLQSSSVNTAITNH